MKYDEIIAERERKTIYRVGDKIVKLHNEDYDKADVLNEALNQSRMEGRGLNVPKILEVTTIEGKWAIVSEYIEGKTIQELMEENPDKFDEYLELFIDVQIKIHATKSPLINKLNDKMQRKIMDAEIDNTTKYELHTRLVSANKCTQVCHGDFNPSNVVVRPDGECFILDWSHVTQGNASADVARTYLMFCLHKKEDVAKKYLEMFCKKVNIPTQNVQRWFPIVAASQSVKHKPEERDFLLSWVNVVDYE